MTIKDLDVWLAEAKNDFKAAEVLEKSKLYNNAVFFYVQCAEKAVKALLYYYNIQAWGHSIFSLLKEYEENGHQIHEDLKKFARELEIHYARSRYPDASPEISPRDAYNKDIAAEVRKKAKLILNYVEEEREALLEDEE